MLLCIVPHATCIRAASWPLMKPPNYTAAMTHLAPCRMDFTILSHALLFSSLATETRISHVMSLQ